MEATVLKVVAGTYQELPMHTPVINVHQIGEVVWIELPTGVSKQFELFELHEVGQTNTEVMFTGCIERCNMIWLKVKASILNRSAGQHVYRLSFIDKTTLDTHYLYVSYVIQDNNPDKPYIYMQTSDNICNCECNLSKLRGES